MAKINGMEVPTVNIRGTEYPKVATRVQVAHNGALGSGFSMVGNEIVSIKDRHFIKITILVADHQFSGTAEIHFGLTDKSADATSPLETAETSALGRALAFAGFIVDTIASADEMERAGHAFVDSEPPRQMPAQNGHKALPAAQNTLGAECAALGHQLLMDEKAYRAIVHSYTHDGKVAWASVKSALETKIAEQSIGAR